MFTSSLPLSLETGVSLPFFGFLVPAGFPSPADDHLEATISLCQLLDVRTPHTDIVCAIGHSMSGAGIFDDDLLIVDRSRSPVAGDIVACSVEGDATLARWMARDKGVELVSEPKDASQARVQGFEGYVHHGVVRWSLRYHGTTKRPAFETKKPGSLDHLMGLHAPSTYLARCSGESMIGAGIFDLDVLVIDRERMGQCGEVVIAVLNNEPLVKRLHLKDNQLILRSENPKFGPRYILPTDEYSQWGVVTWSLHYHGK